jgi:hypothetical protein
MGTSQRMGHAALVQRLAKTVVRGGAVVDQSAGVVKADDLLECVGTAVRVDDITSGLVTNPGMEPDRAAAVAPAGFIGADDLGRLDRVLDFLVSAVQFVGGAEHDAGRGAGPYVDAVGLLEVIGDLAIGQAGALIEVDDTGLGIGAELALRRTGGIAGL